MAFAFAFAFESSETYVFAFKCVDMNLLTNLTESLTELSLHRYKHVYDCASVSYHQHLFAASTKHWPDPRLSDATDSGTFSESRGNLPFELLKLTVVWDFNQ